MSVRRDTCQVQCNTSAVSPTWSYADRKRFTSCRMARARVRGRPRVSARARVCMRGCARVRACAFRAGSAVLPTSRAGWAVSAPAIAADPPMPSRFDPSRRQRRQHAPSLPAHRPLAPALACSPADACRSPSQHAPKLQPMCDVRVLPCESGGGGRAFEEKPGSQGGGAAVRDRVVAQRQLLDVRLQSAHIQHDTCHTVEGRLSTHPKQKSRNVNAPFQPRCHVKVPHCCGVSRAIGTRAHTAACGAPWKLLLLLLL
jgi:hypothetical protein